MMTNSDAATGRARRSPVDPRLLEYARASRPFFVALVAIGITQTAVIVAFAWLLTTAITGAIDGRSLEELLPVLSGLVCVALVRAVLLWVREATAARAAATVQSQLRTALVAAVGRLGPGWLERRSSASLAVTAGRGLEALEAYFGRYLPQLVQTAIATPVLVAVMWWQDWISGLTVLLTLPLIPIFMILIGMATRTLQNRQWRTLSALAARFADTVNGLSTLTVFGRQHRAAASLSSVTDTYRRETMRVLRVSFLSGFMLEFLASISVAIVAVSIGFRLIDGAIALSVGLFVLLLAPEAYLPLRQVGVQFHAAAEGVAATDDVFAVLDAAAAADGAKPTPIAPAPAAGTSHLRLRGVRVIRGDDTDERMLPPVDLEARGGRVTLIEGPSGSGKSSLLAALRGAARFEGEATVGGVDVRDLRPAEWLAWAGQGPGLVTGTISENVALGDPAPDPARITEALRHACADELDPAFALGVQGAGLSGGQAQRVAVARAIHRVLAGRAQVIALDEPSAALDAETEARLWRSVRDLADAGAAVVLVSHRASARAIADDIVTLGAPAEVTS
jgi:ATP-binding cassette subfamily C protein CydD